MNPFRHDGHLQDLAIEDLLDGEAASGAEAHVTECDACRVRVEAARAHDEVALPPLSRPRPANNQRHWVLSVAPLLAAAAVLLVAAPLAWRWLADDGIRVRGSGMQLRVYLDEGESSRRLHDGDPIAGGDRLGFSVQHRSAGYLMIVGIDARDEAYLCYPQRGGGAAERVEAAGAPRDLPEAIRMDDAPGAERLVALLCDAPFDFERAVRAAHDEAVPSGCARAEVSVVKP